jgi:hypothetical protein
VHYPIPLLKQDNHTIPSSFIHNNIVNHADDYYENPQENISTLKESMARQALKLARVCH